MSEEEIIKYIKDEIENETDTFHWFDDTPNNETRKQIEESINAHQGLLELYNKEKEENKESIKALEEWINGERVSIHCIPKLKIREKIKELEEQDKESRFSKNYLVIPILQELLEESEE